MSERYFVTGALGCIGAWIVRTLVQRGDTPIVFDMGSDRSRLEAILTADAIAAVDFVEGDITDGAAVHRALATSGARRVIHLAGVQVPTCRANPVLGAMVNVVGTLHLFEAARTAGVERVAYASSAAVIGESDDGEGPVSEEGGGEPTTHYGWFKRTNEGNARVYYLDHGLSSAGLRPLAVYGVGRDTGVTSDPTEAIRHAVLGRPFRIRFSGDTDFVYVRDAAEAFVACADRAPEGAHVFNMHGETAPVARFVQLVEETLPKARGLIDVEGAPIPIPPRLDDSALRRAVSGVPSTSLQDGIAETIERFMELKRRGWWAGETAASSDASPRRPDGAFGERALP
ncbi:MAG: NAD-dependent epimerase/dehydratase family protein [Luteitalea sp.]|nr:NAD-dependent epimerase/dehydratase family protein [Luteitalea sp.]